MNGIKEPVRPQPAGMQLFDAEGRRLYFTEDERRAFMAAAARPARGQILLRRPALDRLQDLRSPGVDAGRG
jgi:hypothetical protein